MPLIRLLPFVLLIALSGCVTEYNIPKKPYDKQSALEANIKLGMAYLQQDSRENASRAFINALKIDNNSAEANQGMALVHQLNGENDMAEKRFKRALKSRSDFSLAGVQASYGRFLLETDRYKEALKYFDLASQDLAYISRAEALYYKGVAAMNIDDLDMAEKSFGHAINLDKKFNAAAIELADISIKRENFTEAKRYLDTFSSSGKASARSLWLGIQIERVFDNKDKEEKLALQLKEAFPYSKEYLEYKKLTLQK